MSVDSTIAIVFASYIVLYKYRLRNLKNLGYVATKLIYYYNNEKESKRNMLQRRKKNHHPNQPTYHTISSSIIIINTLLRDEISLKLSGVQKAQYIYFNMEKDMVKHYYFSCELYNEQH